MKKITVINISEDYDGFNIEERNAQIERIVKSEGYNGQPKEIFYRGIDAGDSETTQWRLEDIIIEICEDYEAAKENGWQTCDCFIFYDATFFEMASSHLIFDFLDLAKELNAQVLVSDTVRRLNEDGSENVEFYNFINEVFQCTGKTVA